MSNGFCPDHSPQYYEGFIRELAYTKSFREALYKKINLKGARRILEVGFRQGWITEEIRKHTDAQITAIDTDHLNVANAAERIQGIEFFRDATDKLSMRDETFDIVLCHYFFIWKPKPFKALMELKRVCKKDGYVVALAEPDYTGWIEHPDLELGDYFYKTVKKEGGDPSIGKKLLSLFSSGGLETEISINTRAWPQEELENCIENDWNIILSEGLITNEEYEKKIDEERKIINDKLRVIGFPIFTAVGKKVILAEDVIVSYD
ncbi:MAG: methyltransferase domain-containing protein [Candidatus Heimdallarchaeota archaeon]|nr:methyltransferase domain-containing protein [Candidatus Heimdallarchaeota archaeon]